MEGESGFAGGFLGKTIRREQFITEDMFWKNMTMETSPKSKGDELEEDKLTLKIVLLCQKVSSVVKRATTLKRRAKVNDRLQRPVQLGGPRKT